MKIILEEIEAYLFRTEVIKRRDYWIQREIETDHEEITGALSHRNF